MKIVGVLIVALALTGLAVAAPDGFRESTRLSPVAQALSVPEAKVYCALTPASWRDANPGNLRWASLNGKVRLAENAMYLAPWSCLPLQLWKRGQVVPLADVGRALLTLAHETVHLRGIY